MTTENTVKLALLNFFNTATNILCIYADQSGSKPDYPYATIKVISSANLGGMDEAREIDDTGSRDIVSARTMVLDFNVYQGENADVTAFDYMQMFNKDLNKQTLTDALWNNSNISIIGKGNIQNLSDVLETHFEDRAQMEVSINWMDEFTDDTGYIETVEVNDRIIEI